MNDTMTRGDGARAGNWARVPEAAGSVRARTFFTRAGTRFARRLAGPYLVYFLVLLVSMVVATALIGLIFQETLQRDRVQMASKAFSVQLSGLVGFVRTLPPQARDAYLDRLAAHSGGDWAAVDPGPHELVEPSSRLVSQFLEGLRDLMPAHTIAFSAPPKAAIWFLLPLGDGRSRWVRIKTPPLAALSGGLMLLNASVTAIAASAAAAYLMLRLRRSLGWLADALDSVDARSGFVASVPATDGEDDLLELHRHFNQMARRVTDAKSELALMMGGISRDLAASLDRLRAAQPRSTTPAAAIACVDDMERVIRRFSDYAHGSEEGEMRLVDLNQVLQDVVCQTPLAEVAVHMDLGGLPYVRLRRAAAPRIFGNLLDNALRHGARPFEIRSALEEGWVVVRILDRGQGVSPDELPLLGRAFYRTEAARARGAGSGLSLAVAREEAQLHGGVLRLARRPGGGLQAEVWLPVARLQPGEEAAITPVSGARAVPWPT